MNYFAHGMRFIDRPYFLAGTACPDWLSVADRRVRLRDKNVRPFAEGNGTVQAEIAAGILQHLDDDRWFHQTRAFFEITAEMSRLIRDVLGPEDGFRPGLLGHISTELILDGVLIERDPQALDDYYEALGKLDAEKVERTVNLMVRHTTSKLAGLIPRFHRERFLHDYLDPEQLLFRLNQVMFRIKLKQLPEDLAEVMAAGRTIIGRRTHDLLPVARFSA